MRYVLLPMLIGGGMWGLFWLLVFNWWTRIIWLGVVLTIAFFCLRHWQRHHQKNRYDDRLSFKPVEEVERQTVED